MESDTTPLCASVSLLWGVVRIGGMWRLPVCVRTWGLANPGGRLPQLRVSQQWRAASKPGRVSCRVPCVHKVPLVFKLVGLDVGTLVLSSRKALTSDSSN